MKTNVKQLRQELGLSQVQLAAMAGVTRQTINTLENGRYNPSLVLSYKITRLLKASSIEDVFLLDDEDIL
ncbi:hypothetical protein ALNOE001_16840 [Candidatus Methanobinarius endosymbioticus]|uniref:HTH cro/C1-type domain-containing protein n=1 Tax=Candidatus Methanobinarius endosymbioticus TaxID=2006182 RepID=A0A366M9A4_9EURY|nr:hypothetical protein ALNOE001_16840 [Candidatus Methanobinarius endosymbioticus]